MHITLFWCNKWCRWSSVEIIKLWIHICVQIHIVYSCSHTMIPQHEQVHLFFYLENSNMILLMSQWLRCAYQGHEMDSQSSAGHGFKPQLGLT